MSVMERRILGPSHNRLVEVVQYPTARDEVSIAGADILTSQLGWTDYSGPAVTEGGWIKPGSDPLLKPRNTLKR